MSNSLENIRADFPILKRMIHGKPLIYLDSAATSQKPKRVIDAVVDFYERHNANVHRGIHSLGDEATRMYEEARETIAEFIGATDRRELVFVRNTTEAINLVAYSWGRKNIRDGDEILLTEMEHHSNIVPWQMVAKEKNATVKFVNVTNEGKLDLEDLKHKLSLKTKIVAIVHVSNFLGTINPIKEIAEIIRKQRTENRKQKTNPRLPLLPTPYPLLLIDGAQAVPHMPVDVHALGCDFYAFSGHKMYGPMGVGCLWGRLEILEEMPPFLTGGGMISQVTPEATTFAQLPDRFDAGTPNVAGAIGLAAAVRYLQHIGMKDVRQHELKLVKYTIDRLNKGLTFVGSVRQRLDLTILGPRISEERGGLVAFTVKINGREVHGHDVAQVLDSDGVAVRSGHHCTMPMHEKLGLTATTRISLAVYNTTLDIDRFVSALRKIPEVFNT